MVGWKFGKMGAWKLGGMSGAVVVGAGVDGQTQRTCFLTCKMGHTASLSHGG